MQPEHWLKIKDEIKNNYEKYDGFVITHGTDTMAYTASALSYKMKKFIDILIMKMMIKKLNFMTH